MTHFKLLYFHPMLEHTQKLPTLQNWTKQAVKAKSRTWHVTRPLVTAAEGWVTSYFLIATLAPLYTITTVTNYSMLRDTGNREKGDLHLVKC